MQQFEFWWDDNNVDHIADHGGEPYEAEEVITNRLWLKRGGEGKYLAYGQTDAGRFLVVVLALKADDRLRVVTARDMTPAEKRWCRQR